MKKIISAFMFSLLLTGCTSATEAMNELTNIKDNLNQDIQEMKSSRQYSEDSGASTLSNVMMKLNAKKDAEIKAVNKQIHEKELQIAKIVIDPKLTNTQKKAKTSLLQSDINNLKIQKQNIELTYKQKFRTFQFE